MKYAIHLLSCLLILAFIPLEINANIGVISSLNFEGLQKTNVEYLRSRLLCQPGDSLNKERLEEDIQRLWDLQLFSQIEADLSEQSDGTIITFKVKEKFTYGPIFQLDLSEQNLRLGLGLIDYNLWGNATRAQVQYTYYQRHSYLARIFSPHIQRSKWGAGLELARYATREPTYFGEGNNLVYAVTKWTVGPMLRYELGYQHFLEATGAYLHENYEKDLQRSEHPDLGPQEISFNKLLFKIGHRFSKIRYFYHYQNGWSNALSLEGVYSYSPMEGINQDYFWKISNVSKYFKRHGKGNIAARLRLGISENMSTPFPAFVKDNYINLRGIGDRPERGSAEATFNLEERYTILHNKRLTMQAVAFTDIGTLLPAGQAFSNLADEMDVFAGAGLRLQFPNIFQSVIRLDFGLDVQQPDRHQLLLGFGQFF